MRIACQRLMPTRPSKKREPNNENRAETQEKGKSAGNQTQGAQGEKRNNEAQGAEERKTNGAQGEAGKGAQQTSGHAARQSKRLDEHQASQFRERLRKESHVTQTDINFNARIGVDVPGSVHLEALPTDIVAEYPQFRGYDFVMVRDEIVIVDPSSRQVVEVVGGPVTGRTAAVNRCSTTQ